MIPQPHNYYLSLLLNNYYKESPIVDGFILSIASYIIVLTW